MSTQQEQPKKRSGVSGLAIPAGILIGIGVGILVDNTSAGVLRKAAVPSEAFRPTAGSLQEGF